jgi:N-acetylglucosaminyldiphosphoundecaprenol N-acetyl-beta-D-mannosaminyltransferase
VNVLGVGISVINLTTVRDRLAAAVAERRQGYVCIRDVHGVVRAQRDEEFRGILNRAFLCTPDGMPLVWAGRLAGHKNMGRVYGPDLMEVLCDWTRRTEYTHFLYGGREGVADLLRQRLEARYPGLRIVGTYTPPFRPLTAAEEADLAARVAAVRPDFFWVGLSTPKQEQFMAAHLGRLDTTLMLGFGAAFDFHAGTARQAPRWIQRSGFEWLFRLCTEPRRLWRRYFHTVPVFLALAFCQAVGLKKYRLSPEP